MTTTEKRAALAEMGLTALMVTDEPDVMTETQRRNVASYVDWLAERYATDIEVRVSILDKKTVCVSARDDSGTYDLRVPRQGNPYVWADDFGHSRKRVSRHSFFLTYEARN